MGNSLSAKGAGRRRNGKADFALLVGEIETALRARHSMRSIYERHRDRLGFGYVQFTRYVREFLGCPARLAAAGVAAGTAPDQPAMPAAAPAGRPRQALSTSPKRFQFDPMSVDRKDLV
jgi:hypothetical protein